MAESKLEHALALAAEGFWVFPLVPGSKLPLIDGWQHKATRDPEQIRKWWTCPVTGWEQDHNIGVATGRFGDDQALLVVDIDCKNGKDGDEQILRLELEGHDFPPTRQQITPSGGRHLVYVVDEPVKQGANVVAPGVDVRSAGGYIVGSGSVTPLGVYVADDRRIAPAPQWLVEHCGRGHQREPAVSRVQGHVDPARAQKRAIEYLTNHAPLAVEGQGGDQTTFIVAAKLKDLGVSEELAHYLMTVHWNDRCSPPWGNDDLARKVANAYRYGREAPGAAAPEVQFRPEPDSDRQTTGASPHPFDRLNQEFAFVLAGGGHHILWETKDANGRFKLEHLTESAFHKKFASWTMQVGNKNKPVTELWMTDKRRRSYDGLCFMPGREAPERFYNLWRGFAVEPADTAPPEGTAAVEAFFEHVRENICRGDDRLYQWLVGYFAHMVQRPWEKPLTALVFRGAKGVGKNITVECVGHLLGNHFLLTSNRRYLVGNFNGHLENCLFFVLDEAFWSGDKQAEGTLKDLITGATHVIEHKGKEPYAVDNRTRIAILGNEDWLVPASHDERRFAAFDIGDGRKQDRRFFREMWRGMALGGFRLLLRRLLDVPLAGLDFDEAPRTAALLDQKHASLEPLEQWWADCLAEGWIVGGDFGGDAWPREVDTERFRAAFKRYIKDRNIRSRVPDTRTIGRMLRRCCPSAGRSRKATGYYYKLPSLEDARAEWCNWIGHPVSWND